MKDFKFAKQLIHDARPSRDQFMSFFVMNVRIKRITKDEAWASEN